MPEHSPGYAGLFDFRIPVEHSADPAKINLAWADRTSSKYNGGSSAVIGNRVENFAWIANALIDDFDRWHNVLRRA
jgi:hypothetical protein